MSTINHICTLQYEYNVLDQQVSANNVSFTLNDTSTDITIENVGNQVTVSLQIKSHSTEKKISKIELNGDYTLHQNSVGTFNQDGSGSLKTNSTEVLLNVNLPSGTLLSKKIVTLKAYYEDREQQVIFLLIPPPPPPRVPDPDDVRQDATSHVTTSHGQGSRGTGLTVAEQAKVSIKQYIDGVINNIPTRMAYNIVGNESCCGYKLFIKYLDIATCISINTFLSISKSIHRSERILIEDISNKYARFKSFLETPNVDRHTIEKDLESTLTQTELYVTNSFCRWLEGEHYQPSWVVHRLQALKNFEDTCVSIGFSRSAHPPTIEHVKSKKMNVSSDLTLTLRYINDLSTDDQTTLQTAQVKALIVELAKDVCFNTGRVLSYFDSEDLVRLGNDYIPSSVNKEPLATTTLLSSKVLQDKIVIKTDEAVTAAVWVQAVFLLGIIGAIIYLVHSNNKNTKNILDSISTTKTNQTEIIADINRTGC